MEIGPHPSRSQEEWPVVLILGRARPVAVAEDLGAHRAYHLRVAEVATLSDVDVSALELQQESGLGKASYEALLSIAVERGDFESLPGGQVRPKGLVVEADPQADQVHGLLDGGAFKPPSAAELIPHVGSEDKAEALLVKLCDQNRAVRVAPGMYFARGRFDAAIEAVTRNCEANGQLVIPDLREELATSRKYLIPLLEHLDATGVTMRQGAHRVLRKR